MLIPISRTFHIANVELYLLNNKLNVNIKCTDTLESSWTVFFKSHVYTPYHSCTSFPGIYPSEMKPYNDTETYTWMFIPILFIISKRVNNLDVGFHCAFDWCWLCHMFTGHLCLLWRSGYSDTFPFFKIGYLPCYY